MYFSVIQCNEALYQEARAFFLGQGRSDVLSKSANSLIGAYKITQYMWQKGKNHFSFMDGVYSCEELFFSTSHSDGLLVMTIDTKKVAVDIENIRPRDESLLQNIRIPDSQFSIWENFYIQRCSKECLIKYLDLTAEKMNYMSIISLLSNQHYMVGEWLFDYLLILNYNGKQYPVHISIANNQVLAFIHEHIPVFMP